MIRAESSVDAAAIDRIVSNFGGNDTYTAKLRSSGSIIPELSLVSEDVDSSINGYIGCAAARAGELDTPLITGIHAENEETARALVAELIRIAKENGRDALLVFNDGCKKLFKDLGFYSAVCFGIIPPGELNDMGTLHCLCLTEKRLDEAVKAELPDVIGKTFVEPLFDIHSRLTEEEYSFTAMDTRRRSRIVDYILESVMIVISVILFIIKKRFLFLSPAIIIVVYMVKTFIRLKKFREKLEECKVGDGRLSIDDHLIFYDDRIMVYMPQVSNVYFRRYTDYHFMFLKKDYLMIGYPSRDNNMNGNTIKYRDIHDKDAFVRFIKEKSGGIRIMR